MINLIIKINREVNEIKSWFLKMINKTNKPLACFFITKYKREMIPAKTVINERGDITIAHRYENDNRGYRKTL